MHKYITLLQKLNLISEKRKIKFFDRTRDVNGLSVWIDDKSKVIYIDDPKNISLNYDFSNTQIDELQSKKDLNRRLKNFSSFIRNKNICELGFGNGKFMMECKNSSLSVEGVEQDINLLTIMNKNGFNCSEKINKLSLNFDSVFIFHTFEHLLDPEKLLYEVKDSMKKGGKLVIEVPSANDLLLKFHFFRAFGLWSEHKILHTHESLYTILDHVGFKNIQIKSIQRYGIDNHLYWLTKRKPRGHGTNLKYINNLFIKVIYDNLLRLFKRNDTIYAVCEK